MRFISSAIYWN